MGSKDCMKKVIRVIAILLCFALFSVLLCGCKDYNAKAVIYYEVDTAPKTIDPQLASTETELMMVRNLFEGLMRVNENGEVVNGVVDSYTYSDLVYTFYISESAKWNDGRELTAYDFEFAFKRAVDPATKAPYGAKLSSILNAELILSGTISAEHLGVKAKDSSTLEITMSSEDISFLYKLTTAVCMPCNQDFFESCNGEYGLSKDTILTNGTYQLTKWAREDFAARLHRSEKYYGNFQANNSAIFLSVNQDKDNLDLLKKSSVDIAYITPEQMNEATAANLICAQTDNIVWVMRFSKSFSYDLKRAFVTAVDRSLYAGNLGIGFNVAYTLFPDSIATDELEDSYIPYDIDSAKAIYKSALKELPNKKLPSTTLIYYKEPSISKPINDIVGHWQNHLGAYLNIQPTDDINEINSKLDSDSNYIAIYPIYITDKDPTAYTEQLGYPLSEAEIKSLRVIQDKIIQEYNIIPLAIQNSVLAYSPNLVYFVHDLGNGTIDFSFLKKK